MPAQAGDGFLMAFGHNVRAARLRLGLTVEGLADCTGINVLMLDVIERGESGRLDLLGLGRLAIVLEQTRSALTAQIRP